MTTAHRQATNPNTDPTRLAQLAELTHLAPHIAQNPNTPTDLLLRLARHYPDQVLANPAFQLELLTDPDLPKNTPKETLLQLALRDNTPTLFVDEYRDIANLQEQARLTRRQDTNAPHLIHQHKTQPQQLTQKDLTNLQHHTSNNPTIPTTRPPLEIISIMVRNNESWLRSPALAPAELLELVANKYLGTGYSLELIAHNPAAPTHLLKRLLLESNGATRRAAALHPNMTPETLRDAARRAIDLDDYELAASILTNLAQRKDASAKDIRWLLNWCEKRRQGHVGAPLYAASNPNTDPKTQARLYDQAITTKNKALLESLARNPNLTEDVATKLLEGDALIREALANNAHNLTHRLQEALLNDPVLNVRNAAIHTTNHPEEIRKHATSPLTSDREKIARNPHLPHHLLKNLKDDREKSVREHAKHNPNNTPRGRWGEYGLITEDEVLRDASSPSLSESQGQELLDGLREALHVMPNHAFPPRALQALAQNKHQPHETRLEAATLHARYLTQHPAKALHDQTTTPNHQTMAIAVANNNTTSHAAHANALPTEALEGWVGVWLAHHVDWRVRYVLACRSDLPVGVRSVLERDGDVRVLEALKGVVVRG